MKTLTVVSTGLNRPDLATAVELEKRDEFPRVSLYQTVLQSDMLDEKFMKTGVPGWRKLLYRFVPKPLDQVVEAFMLRNRYDVVVTWAERLGIPFALLLKLTGSRIPHITLNSWISGRKKSLVLKFVHTHVTKFLLWSSVQRDHAINQIGISPGKIAFIRKFADQRFWRPMEGARDTICAVGVEMRDYPTLIDAIRGLDIPCHIAAGLNRGLLYDTVGEIADRQDLPPNLTVGPKGYADLRRLYAQSRFVVIPLRDTDTDNGLTCMLEAMSMGKAVICSRTRGQVDVLEDGVTGIFVPVGDTGALRAAILRLWNDPAICEEIGRRGRAFIERYHTIEQFVDSVRRVAEEVCGLTEKERPNGREVAVGTKP